MSTSSSNVWRFFKVLEDDNTKAVCLCCEEEGSCVTVSRGGKDKRKFTTTNLRNHLSIKHPAKFSTLQIQAEEEKKKGQLKRKSDDACSTAEHRKRMKTQLTLQSSFDASKQWDKNSVKSMTVTKLIGEMIALDNQPFSIVEDIGFVRLLKHAFPNYQIPSRIDLSSNVIPDLYTRARSVVLRRLENSQSCSFTTDVWTCKHTNNSFISLSVHFIDETTRRSYVLHASHFPGSHTGERIAEKFNEMIENWNIPISNCHLLITDNAANMCKAASLIGVNHASCFLHTLQLVIKDSILSQRSVNDMISKSRKIVTHFHHSSLASDRLKTIQEELELKVVKLIQDVTTR